MLPRFFQNPNGFNVDFSARRNMINFIKRTAPVFGFYIISTAPIYQNTLINTKALYQQLKNLVVRARKGDYNSVGKKYAAIAAQIGIVLKNNPILPISSTYVLSLAEPTALTFTWGATTGADNYVIQRSTTSDFATYLQRYSGPLLTFQDTGLTASTTYYYRLKAQGVNYVDSLYSNLTALTTYPTPTGFVTSLPTTTTLTFGWAATPGANNYIVDRSLTSDFSVFVQRYTGTLLTFQDTALAASTTYYYRIKAQGPTYPDSLYALITGLTSLVAPPNFIVSLAASTALTFTWDAVTNANNYIIERSTTADFSVFVQRYTGSLLTFQDTGLTASTTYYYRIKAQGAVYPTSLYSSVTGITTV